MTERQRQRCRTLADYLDGVPRERFEITAWIEPGRVCGTVACAAGWAGQIHAFREEGFACDRNGPTLEGFTPAMLLHITRPRQVLREFFGNHEPFFEDDYDSTYVGPAKVAARLREVADASENTEEPS